MNININNESVNEHNEAALSLANFATAQNYAARMPSLSLTQNETSHQLLSPPHLSWIAGPSIGPGYNPARPHVLAQFTQLSQSESQLSQSNINNDENDDDNDTLSSENEIKGALEKLTSRTRR